MCIYVNINKFNIYTWCLILHDAIDSSLIIKLLNRPQTKILLKCSDKKINWNFALMTVIVDYVML